MDDMFFRKLTVKEEKRFRRWARKNWKPGDEVNPVWHPVVRDEIEKMQNEVEKAIGVVV